MDCKACGNELKPEEHIYCHHQSCVLNRMMVQFESPPKKKTRKERSK